MLKDKLVQPDEHYEAFSKPFFYLCANVPKSSQSPMVVWFPDVSCEEAARNIRHEGVNRVADLVSCVNYLFEAVAIRSGNDIFVYENLPELFVKPLCTVWKTLPFAFVKQTVGFLDTAQCQRFEPFYLMKQAYHLICTELENCFLKGSELPL